MDSKYVYNSDGEKMKAIYFTPFPREVVNPVLDDTVVARPPIHGGRVNAKRRVEIYPSNPPAEVGIHDSLVYCGNFIYSNQSLEQVLFDGGYMTLDSLGLPHYHFYQHDHLGSVRAVVDENGVTEERDDYYPFGATYGQDATPNVRRYKYNGKELDRMHGLNLLDYGARWYDPLLGRFTTMDPLCEKYYSISPYAYCANNPVRYIDPDGKKIKIPKQSQTQVLQMINTYSKTQYKVDKKGYMCINKDAGINEKGSAHYSERLDATISAEGNLTIMVGDTYTAKKGSSSQLFDVKEYGGGLTDSKTDKTNVKTVVSGNGHTVHDTKGNELVKPAGEVLIHEIVGHAAPAIVGSETGNAVKNENIVRRELNLPERVEEEKHYE